MADLFPTWAIFLIGGILIGLLAYLTYTDRRARRKERDASKDRDQPPSDEKG